MNQPLTQARKDQAPILRRRNSHETVNPMDLTRADKMKIAVIYFVIGCAFVMTLDLIATGGR